MSRQTTSLRHWRHGLCCIGLCLLLGSAGSACAQDDSLDATLAQHVAAGDFYWWVEPGERERVEVYFQPVRAKQEVLQDRTVSLSSIESFFKSVRSHIHTQSFEAGRKPVTIDFQKATYGKELIYDVGEEYAERFADTERGSCRKSYFLAYNPLSLVGRVFSYEQEQFILSSCTPVTGSKTVKTIDLETQEATPLQRWVEEASLVASLKNDQWILQQLRERSEVESENYLARLDSAETLHEMLALFDAGLPIDADALLHRYAFLTYDTSEDRVAVRLVLDVESRTAPTDRYVQLGMWVRPKSAFRRALQQADRGEGFFLERFPNGLAE